jgi:hypothetical protein
MSTQKRTNYILLLLAGLVWGCTNSGGFQNDPLPYVFVNEQVYLNELRAAPLNVQDGEFIYINGGLKGIIIYRRAAGQFIALERHSTGVGGCRVRVDITKQYVLDTCTNTQFDFSGGFRSGASAANLRQYSVSFDGNRIAITN